MNYEQPPFETKEVAEPTTNIKDVSLAEDIAYAEKPYRDAMVELKKSPDTDAAVTALGQIATEKGNEVGRAYVAQKQVELDMLREQFGGDAELTSVRSVETESSLERWANDAMQALAEKYGVSPESFELMSYEEGGRIHDIVVYAAANGIDLGDSEEDYDKARAWSAVMDPSPKNTARHTVAIGGVEYDDREGMTYGLYDQLVGAAKNAERLLPDSKYAKITNNSGDEWYSWTMMTGEPLTAEGGAPIASVDDDGSVDRDWADVDSDGVGLRFRPVVERSTEDLR